MCTGICDDARRFAVFLELGGGFADGGAVLCEALAQVVEAGFAVAQGVVRLLAGGLGALGVVFAAGYGVLRGAGFGVGVACAVVGAAFVLGVLPGGEGGVVLGDGLGVGALAGVQGGPAAGKGGGGDAVLLLDVALALFVVLPVVQALAQGVQDGVCVVARAWRAYGGVGGSGVCGGVGGGPGSKCAELEFWLWGYA